MKLNKVVVVTLLPIFLGFGMPALSAMSNADIEQSLVKRITDAKKNLESEQKKISQERMDYGRRLDNLQGSVVKLRADAAAAQRVKDEKLLGLDKLEERLEQWQNQSNYQHHIINAYADEFLRDSVAPHNQQTESNATPGISQELKALVAKLSGGLTPQWTPRSVIEVDGEIRHMEVLAIGPVSFGLDNVKVSGGLLGRDLSGSLALIKPFKGDALAQLMQLHAGQPGAVTLDPTLGSAEKIASHQEGVLSHLSKGGVWIVPILFFGFISLVISIVKAIEFWRLPTIDEQLVAQIHASLAKETEQGKTELKSVLQHARGAQRNLIDIALATPVSEQRDDKFIAFLMEYRHKIERFMGVVATSAAISPLLGLLGTVSGMISTFKMMTIFGSGDAATVSGGISEALVTTELGLIVAIPSLIVSALLSRKIKSYTNKLESFAIRLSKVKFVFNDSKK